MNKRIHTHPLSGAISLLLIAAVSFTCAEDKAPEEATLAFYGGARHNLPLRHDTFTIDTIAGRQELTLDTISSIVVNQGGNGAVLLLRGGERWKVDAKALIAALFGQDEIDALAIESQMLRSLSFSRSGMYPAQQHHGYKILLNDDSTAIIDPASVTLPVDLGHAKAEIPLGTIGSIKFTLRMDTLIPKSVFIRLLSGQVYKLAWAGQSPRLTCKSVNGNQLTIRFSDILGFLPPNGYNTDNLSNGKTPLLTLIDSNNKQEQIPAKLQMWRFKTPLGPLSLPSTFVTAFTIPHKWRDNGNVQTIFGESFEGKPDFETIYYDRSGQLETVDISQLSAVEQPPGKAPLKRPQSACVFDLDSDSSVIAFPYAHDAIIKNKNGEPMTPEKNSSVVRMQDDKFIYMAANGQQQVCQPADDTIPVCLVSSGQKIDIDWKQIRKLSFNNTIPVRTVTPRHHTEPESTAPEVAEESSPASDDTEPDKKPASSRRFSLLDWFRGDDDSPEPAPDALSLDLPWGTIAVSTNQIRNLYRRNAQARIVLTTTAADILTTDMDALPAALLDAKPVKPPMRKLPVYLPANDNSVRIRFTSGDIVSGTIPNADLPLDSTTGNEADEQIALATLQKVIRTGEDTLLYVTARGTTTGKRSRERFRFAPTASDIDVEITIRDIDALVTGKMPLPPPVAIKSEIPLYLAGMVRLPGGTFTQGSGTTGMRDETPRIQITLSPFYLDATETTRAQFAAFIENSGYKTIAERNQMGLTWRNPGFLQQPDDPVVCVAWPDAAEFCNWRSKQAGLPPVYTIEEDGTIKTDRTADGYRLPTESEWEFAAGGLRQTIYPWGNVFMTSSQNANFMADDPRQDDGWRWTNPVNAFPPDVNGLYGMAGNVWEWCEDWYFSRAYDALKSRAPLNPCIQKHDAPGLTHRVMRGGSYRNKTDLLRVSSRGNGLPQAYAPHVGFRCARNAN